MHIDHRAANSLEYFSTPGVVVEKSSAKSIINSNNLNNLKKASSNPYSKTYFEELLNSYKSHSPYYKDHQQKDSSQLIKSLSATKGKCGGKKCKNEPPPGEESEDYYYDYEDEEEDDDEDDDYDDVDNVEAQGDAGYSTTASPVFHESEISKSSKASSQNKINHGSPRPHGSGYGEKPDSNKVSIKY